MAQPGLFPDAPVVDPRSVSPALPVFQKGSATSKEAAVKAITFSALQRRRVADWLTAQGIDGGTQREAGAALGIQRASCCPRFRELEIARVIVKTDVRRAGCFVYVVAGL